ncbi:MAG: tetratricopeptide repeat protein [Planctomycetota bacterium]
MDTEDENFELLAEHAYKFLSVNPLLATGHEQAVLANLELERPESAIPSLLALLELEPLDPAGLHFQLADAYYNLDQVDEARRECLYALEYAPRYRDAHQLLVKIVASRADDSGDDANPTSTPSQREQAEEPPKAATSESIGPPPTVDKDDSGVGNESNLVSEPPVAQDQKRPQGGSR